MRAGRDLTMDERLTMFVSDPIALEQKGEKNSERSEDKTENESAPGPVLPAADYRRSDDREYPDEKELYHSFAPQRRGPCSCLRAILLTPLLFYSEFQPRPQAILCAIDGKKQEKTGFS
jgi:hypothetical protein